MKMAAKTPTQIMTNSKDFAWQAPVLEGPARQLVCAACGTEFTCGLSATCWCADETARLPIPNGAEDCLCRDCLRKAVAEMPSSR